MNTHNKKMKSKYMAAWVLILSFIFPCPNFIVCPVYAQESSPQIKMMDTRISLDVQDADLKGVLKGIAESFNLNIVAGEDIKGTVTITLKDVRLGDALDLILGPIG